MIPDAIELATALPSVVLTPVPRLMLATAGLTGLAVTHSTPATTFPVVLSPKQSTTRTATSLAALATP